MAVFVTHAMEEGWKQQWFYSIMASSFGLQLSVTLRSKYVQLDLSASFVVTVRAVVQLRHCITVPSLFGEFYEIFH